MPNVFATNKTLSSITVAGHKVYYIDSTDAEIVEVQDGNNVKYNAFKYTLSGTPYWYVIDGEHDTWTDDLSAWGYSEVPVGPVLPTVSDQTWCSFTDRAQDRYKIVSADAVARVYDSSKAFDPFLYDANLVYAIKRLYYRYGNTSGVEMPMVNDSGYLAAQNTTGSEIQVDGCYFVTCSDSTATVVTVYDSSNNAYNAFKYTANNTDYYYVLDGTQTDWTDDLSEWGYSLYLTGWANASHTDVSLVRNGGCCKLKDGSGNNIPYNDSVTYTGTRIIDSNGNSTTFDYYGGGVYLMKYSNALSIYNNSSTYLIVQRIEYTVS